MSGESLIPAHGGYRSLKSFQIAQLVYDVTVRFCDRYIDPRSRTHDQMVQAARSGVQNIAEGSQVSDTSKKMEMKLTNVARASLEELRLDYEDFLRQRGYAILAPDHPVLKRFKARRCSTLKAVRLWVAEEHRRTRTLDGAVDRQEHGHSWTDTVGADAQTTAPAVQVRGSPEEPVPVSALVANAALSLLNVCCFLLDRQLAAQADAFEREGGFTERLYRTRTSKRHKA
jgi:four helix bundle suffix protein